MTKTNFQIKTYWGSVLFEYSKKDNTLKQTLEKAVSEDANLTGAYLTDANLRGANLRGANLRGANLRDANLRDANLRGANLRDANLTDANLTDANLTDANLRGAYLTDANLTDANLTGANLEKIQATTQIIPETGSFEAWKKGENDHLIKLEIPAKAKRHNYIGGRKCRAEFVKVLDIRNSKGHKIKECRNGPHGIKTTYRVGEIVKPDQYDPDPLTECSHGIHFFISKQEAKDW